MKKKIIIGIGILTAIVSTLTIIAGDIFTGAAFVVAYVLIALMLARADFDFSAFGYPPKDHDDTDDTPQMGS